MKVIKALFSIIILSILILFLNSKLGELPPIGKFFNPFNGFWRNISAPDDHILHLDEISGLRKPVTIIYDKHLVPHIYAKNEADLYFAQGYVTAIHRLWQMEFQTHAAAGRISEIVGEKALQIDRMNRRIGLTFGAEKTVALLNENKEAMTIMNSYTAGINAFIKQLKPKDLPIEYKLLDYQPEEWTFLKTALLLKYMADVLTAREYNIEYSNMITQMTDSDFQFLYPDFINGQDPIVPAGTEWSYDGPLEKQRLAPNKSVVSDLWMRDKDQTYGSNNWAIAPSRTKRAVPILANDPHLRLTLPSIWFQIHLSSPGINVYGASIPGSPGVTLGFNENIAWGSTNAGRDVRDWYAIQFKDQNHNEYKFGDQWKPVNKRIEQIKIKGGAVFMDTVLYTHHGPIVYDASFSGDADASNLSLNWTAHKPGMELLTFYYLNKAKNYDDYIEALNYYQCPGQNFVFANRDGTIAIKEQGLFPAYPRQGGKYIRDGSLPSEDWNAFVPNEFNPLMKNPARGFVSSANQHPTDTTYPFYYSGIFQYFRNRRINQQLQSLENADWKDMAALQLDNYNLQAFESLPDMLSMVDEASLNSTEKTAFIDLSNWDYFNEADIRAPSLYEAWWDQFYSSIWDEIDALSGNKVYPERYRTVRLLLDDPKNKFFDIQSSSEIETAKEIVQTSFKEAMLEINHWEAENKRPYLWYLYKDTRIAHLARIDAFSKMKIKSGGNKGIVNATSKYWGPSWRMIVELGDPVIGYGIYPGGQSGHPGSPYYDNFVEDWASGQYYPLLFATEIAKKDLLFEREILPSDIQN